MRITTETLPSKNKEEVIIVISQLVDIVYTADHKRNKREREKKGGSLN